MAASEGKLATKPPKENSLDSFIPTSYLALLEGTLLTNGDLKVRADKHDGRFVFYDKCYKIEIVDGRIGLVTASHMVLSPVTRQDRLGCRLFLIVKINFNVDRSPPTFITTWLYSSPNHARPCLSVSSMAGYVSYRGGVMHGYLTTIARPVCLQFDPYGYRKASVDVYV